MQTIAEMENIPYFLPVVYMQNYVTYLSYMNTSNDAI